MNVSFIILVQQIVNMQVSRCINCNHLLSENYHFCPSCGQKSVIHRFTFKHLIHEFFHAFTHADKGILFLVKGLFMHPGKVVSEYVDGKRKKYFNPFTFFLLCLGFFVFMNNLVKPIGELPKVDPTILARIPTQQGKEMYITTVKRSANVSIITQKHSNILALLSLPLTSFFFWIFFRKKQRNYTEFMVAIVFLGSFSNLLFSLTITPLMSITRVHHQPLFWTILSIGIILQAAYISWGIKGLLDSKQRTNFFKVLPVGILSNLFWGIGTTLFFMWYVARERTWIMLSQIWHQMFG